MERTSSRNTTEEKKFRCQPWDDGNQSGTVLKQLPRCNRIRCYTTNVSPERLIKPTLCFHETFTRSLCGWRKKVRTVHHWRHQSACKRSHVDLQRSLSSAWEQMNVGPVFGGSRIFISQGPSGAPIVFITWPCWLYVIKIMINKVLTVKLLILYSYVYCA